MITVAIPYYNSEKYINDALEILISSDFVSEIIIHDDCSNNQIESKHPKIKIYRNETNVGAFKNKYLAVSKSTNEWVYLLDSDNYFFDNSLEVVKNINTQRGKYYSPSQLHLVDDGLDPKLDGKIIKYDFGSVDSIDANNAKELLKSEFWEEFCWLINTGNFFVHRDDYIESMKNVYEDLNYPYFEADAIVFCYNWLKKGNGIEIIQNLWYNHRLRGNSYSHSVGNRNTNSLEYHKSLMAQL
jgi:glycosyltransferase involved in cell wall biosynthesis